MRKVRILCIGKTKDRYLLEGMALLEKKLKRHAQLEWVFLKEANYGKCSLEQAKEEEAQRIQTALGSQAYVVLCDEKGQGLSSQDFAQKIATSGNQGFSQLDFVIGGAFGLAEGLRPKANLILSLSPMTMTHQMVRLFLLEQVYRAHSILAGEPYHHE